MAVIAVVAAENMRRVFAGRCLTVVARIAATQYLRVIHGIDRRPGDTAVAVLTDICRIHVCWMLAGGVHAVVATEAIPRDVRMIENCRCPQGARVAIIALVAGNNMPWWFSGCLNTVVAGTATAGHGCVIHICDRTPGRGRVAGLTHCRRCNVIGRLH